MKKLISAVLCLMMILGMTLPVLAASPKVIFTTDSNFTVGGTVTVDKSETLMSVYNNGISDEYNAYLEGDVQYYWMRNDSYFADGPSITLTESDKGCTFYCMAALFEDEEHTQQISTIYSDKFTVPNSGNPALYPEIKTDALPNGVVGQDYYFQLECTDPDVVYTLFRSSLPDGLYLTQHGEIEGVPEKAGMWYVVIKATPEAGEDYADYAEFEFVIEESEDTYTLEIMRLPKKLTYVSGEKLDMKGLWVRIYTPEGYIDSYDGKYLEYSQQALVTLGEQKIKISYKDAFEIFIVTVVAGEGTNPGTDPTEPPETTEPTEATESTEPTEADKNPGKKPGKDPGKDPGAEPSEDPGKDPEKDPGDPGDTTTIGANGNGFDITTVIIIALAAISIAAVSAVIVLLIKRKN